MAFWIRSIRDPGLDWRWRNRAAENIANRCGLPVRAILDGAAGSSMSMERLAELFREALEKSGGDGRSGKIEAEDVPFAMIEQAELGRPAGTNGGPPTNGHQG